MSYDLGQMTSARSKIILVKEGTLQALGCSVTWSYISIMIRPREGIKGKNFQPPAHHSLKRLFLRILLGKTLIFWEVARLYNIAVLDRDRSPGFPVVSMETVNNSFSV